MYPDSDIALREMEFALKTLPSYASTDELKFLYKDRAQMRFFKHDYLGALSDYVASDKITFNENLKVALLYKLQGNYKKAMSYCNNI